MTTFSSNRLILARKRRCLTFRELAERSGLSPVAVSNIANAKSEPTEDNVRKLASALGYPPEFFYSPDLEPLAVDQASFRSLSSMTAKARDAALASAPLAMEVHEWVRERYDLPEVDLPDLQYEDDPFSAAAALREQWGMAAKPVGNLIELLEARGVRVYSLSERGKAVDAYSYWHEDEPFVFLNTRKTGERSRFDAAHELAHLVMHRHGGPGGRVAETEANAFAGAFLMPEQDVRSQLSHVASLSQVIEAKARWSVSAMALCYRLNRLGLLTEWQYRRYCIHLRSDLKGVEPAPIERETSALWRFVLTDLWQEGSTRSVISRDLNIPEDELNALIFGLANRIEDEPDRSPGELRVV